MTQNWSQATQSEHTQNTPGYTLLCGKELDFIQKVYKILKEDNWLTLNQKINNSGSWVIFFFKKTLLLLLSSFP